MRLRQKKEPAIIPSWLKDSIPGVEQAEIHDEVNSRRSQRIRFPSSRLADYEVFADSDVADFGDQAYLAFLADAEAIFWKQALDVREWREAMTEELKAIVKNIT